MAGIPNCLLRHWAMSSSLTKPSFTRSYPSLFPLFFWICRALSSWSLLISLFLTRSSPSFSGMKPYAPECQGYSFSKKHPEPGRSNSIVTKGRCSVKRICVVRLCVMRCASCGYCVCGVNCVELDLQMIRFCTGLIVILLCSSVLAPYLGLLPYDEIQLSDRLMPP